MKSLCDLMERVDIVSAAADMDMDICGISYDTRTLAEGELFVAVRGYESDGHDFIRQAVEKGAVCILSEVKPPINVPYVLVEDSRKALACVSAAWFGYPAEKLRIVGVTGTNGKTTVSGTVKSIIEKCSGEIAGLIGTNVNKIGQEEFFTSHTTPESYEIHRLFAAMLERGCKYAIMEVSSHALHLDRVHGIDFEVGVFTNLTPDHLDFHSSMNDYAAVKAKLFRYCQRAAINVDDEYANIMIDNSDCSVLTYAVSDVNADLVGKSIKLHSDRVDFCALTIGCLSRVEYHIPGMFSVYNALASIAATILLGFDFEEVSSQLQTCGGVKGRAEVVPIEDGKTVIIDYAHTPDALENIIRTVRGFAKSKVVTLFGCGGDRDRVKRPLMAEVAATYSDFVIVTSDNPRTEDPGTIIDEIITGFQGKKTPYRRIDNRREAIFWALKNLECGDVLILAGKGHETYQIIGKEKTHFDEREVVVEFYRDSRT